MANENFKLKLTTDQQRQIKGELSAGVRKSELESLGAPAMRVSDGFGG